MVKEKIYTSFSDIENMVKNSGARYVRLVNLEGAQIVPYNPIGKPYTDTLAKIKRKLSAINDGVYCIEFKDNSGAGVFVSKAYFGKGEFSPISEKHEPMNKNGTPDAENLLSVETAVKNVQSAALAQAENEFLKKENEALKTKLAELETKIQALEELEEEEDLEESAPAIDVPGWLKETIPAVAPVLDRYFDLQEKKLNFEREKLLSEKGYEIPGLKRRESAKPKNQQLPDIGSPAFNEFAENLADLDNDQFNESMAWIKQNAPAHFNALCPLVYSPDEGAENPDENPEENG